MTFARKTTIAFAALMASAVAAGPAFAQSANQGGAATGGMTQEQMVASQQKVRDALTQAGLKNVTIMDAAYLVSAVTPDNEQIIMIVNSAGQPISAGQAGGQGGTTQQGSTQQNQQSGSTQSNQSGSSTNQSGSSSN